MKYFIRVLALLCLAPLVFAAGAKTFTWNAPVERVDGTPLPNDEIAEYRIYCDGNDTPVHTQANEPMNEDTWPAPDGTFALGTHQCYATAVDTEGQESDPSNTVNFTVSLERPKAPTLAVQ